MRETHLVLKQQLFKVYILIIILMKFLSTQDVLLRVLCPPSLTNFVVVKPAMMMMMMFTLAEIHVQEPLSLFSLLLPMEDDRQSCPVSAQNAFIVKMTLTDKRNQTLETCETL